MSGHSKWSTIKHKKAALDAKKGNVFTKLANAIAVAVKKGGRVGDPEFNFSLRLAVETARAANMPKDNIERAIERGMGKGEGGELLEILLEGYGPEGVAILVEAVTDNRNRTVAEVKTLFDKNGGNIAEPGSVTYLFERLGEVMYEGELTEENELQLIELGAIDWTHGHIWCSLGKEGKIGLFLIEEKMGGVEIGVGYRAKATVKPKNLSKITDLLALLEELDDVQGVYANLE